MKPPLRGLLLAGGRSIRMGRDKAFPADLTAAIRKNAEETVSKVNLLLFAATKDGIVLISTNKRSLVKSGWRPPAINAATPNAAPKSHHMTGKACDVSDPTGSLDKWCMNNLDELEQIGLWLEAPVSTPGWCHLQTVQPRSGNRVFFP
jgi:hypothetical protein